MLRAMDEVPREQFVMPSQVKSAYSDRAMPIACGQTISQPYVVAYMTEQLRGRAAASRSRSRDRFGVSVGGAVAAGEDRSPASSVIGRWRRPRAPSSPRSGYDNVEVIVGDGLAGAPDRAPFDRIIVTAAAEQIPEALLQQLALGGVMILPLGPHGGSQSLVRLTRTDGGFERDDLIGVRFVPLLPGQAREL